MYLVGHQRSIETFIKTLGYQIILRPGRYIETGIVRKAESKKGVFVYWTRLCCLMHTTHYIFMSSSRKLYINVCYQIHSTLRTTIHQVV